MKLIAHRGIHNDMVPENSREAIRTCLASVADGIEIDVRVTADDICVVHHDTKAKNNSLIYDKNFDELHELDPSILRVEEALTILEPFSGLVNVEVKHILGERGRSRSVACIDALAKVVETMGSVSYDLVVSSFSMPNIHETAATMPYVSRAYLAPRGLPFSVIMHRALRYGCEGIHVSVGHLKARKFPMFVQRVHSQGVKVRVFTINDEKDFHLARERGVDAIFTDEIVKMGKLESELRR